jgi:intracellular multiplication protein IcmJ
MKETEITQISLSVKRSKHRLDDPERDHADAKFAGVRESVLVKSKYACVHCGFQSKKFQEVHHLDDNHQNNDPSNLVCVCPLCHSCHHVSYSGLTERACVIYLDPRSGVTQAMLNEMVRRLWIEEETGDKNQRLSAISRLNRFYKQTVAARRKIGGSEPTFIGDFLLTMSDEDYPRRSDILKGVFLLPLKDGYKKQLAYWIEQESKSLPATTWTDIAKQKSLKWFCPDGEDDDLTLAQNLGIRA